MDVSYSFAEAELWKFRYNNNFSNRLRPNKAGKLVCTSYATCHASQWICL